MKNKIGRKVRKTRVEKVFYTLLFRRYGAFTPLFADVPMQLYANQLRHSIAPLNCASYTPPPSLPQRNPQPTPGQQFDHALDGTAGS